MSSIYLHRILDDGLKAKHLGNAPTLTHVLSE